MKFKFDKTAAIVIAVVLAVIVVGIGIMCSGEREDRKTIQVPQVTVVDSLSTAHLVTDTIVVE